MELIINLNDFHKTSSFKCKRSQVNFPTIFTDWWASCFNRQKPLYTDMALIIIYLINLSISHFWNVIKIYSHKINVCLIRQKLNILINVYECMIFSACHETWHVLRIITRFINVFWPFPSRSKFFISLKTSWRLSHTITLFFD